MAVSDITQETLLARLKTILNDQKGWLTDQQYNGFIFNHLILDSSTYNYQVRASGVWNYNLGEKLWLFDPTFTGVDDASYFIYADGSINETTDTKIDTSNSISVSGTLCDFVEVVVEVIQYLKTHKSQQESVNVGSVSFTPQDEERLTVIQEDWRGIVAI